MLRGMLMAVLLGVVMMLTGCDTGEGASAVDELIAVTREVVGACESVKSNADAPAATARIDGAINRIVKFSKDYPNFARMRVTTSKMKSSEAELERLKRSLEAAVSQWPGYGISDQNLGTSITEFDNAIQSLIAGRTIAGPSPRSSSSPVAQAPQMSFNQPAAPVPPPAAVPAITPGEAPDWVVQQRARHAQMTADMKQRQEETQTRLAEQRRETERRMAEVRTRQMQPPSHVSSPVAAAPAPAPSPEPVAPPAAPAVPAAPPSDVPVSQLAPVKIGAKRPQVGANIFVQKGGKWWPATVLKLNTERTLIHYEGQASSNDEWVPFNRMRESATQ